MSVLRLLLAAFAVVLFLAGCAHIEDFKASPRNVCSGNEVNLHWDASGKVTLTSAPALPNTGRKPPTGTESYVVQEPTRFELSAEGLLKDDEPIAVDIDVAPAQRTFGEMADCSDTEGLWTEFVLGDSQLGPSFSVSHLENVQSREVRAEKDGVRDMLPGHGDVGSHLEGLPVRGAWRLTSPLRAGEDCDAALSSVGDYLSVKVHLMCEG